MLKTCLGFKDDSDDATTDYITSINSGTSQLSNMQPMTVSGIYALVTLMGLHLFDPSDHQKAYKELLTYIDQGNFLKIEQVQHILIKHSLARSVRERGFCVHSCL